MARSSALPARAIRKSGSCHAMLNPLGLPKRTHPSAVHGTLAVYESLNVTPDDVDRVPRTPCAAVLSETPFQSCAAMTKRAPRKSRPGMSIDASSSLRTAIARTVPRSCQPPDHTNAFALVTRPPRPRMSRSAFARIPSTGSPGAVPLASKSTSMVSSPAWRVRGIDGPGADALPPVIVFTRRTGAALPPRAVSTTRTNA